MKYLLLPGNTTLSHTFTCLSIQEALGSYGHDALIAASDKNIAILENVDKQYAVLPDMQEKDRSPFPTFAWFRDIQWIVHCIKAEMDLMKKYRPDRVIGIFRFTTKISTHLMGVPYYSLTCGCTLADHNEVLGFKAGDIGLEEQKQYFEIFYNFATNKFNRALKILGCTEITDIRCLLKGDTTFLWDFPEFMPLLSQPNVVHIGPILGKQNFQPEMDIKPFISPKQPLVIMTFGTGNVSSSSITRLTTILLDIGYHIVIAAGGNSGFINLATDDARIMVLDFPPLTKILPYASFIICHGGQKTVFEAISHQTPIFVLPFQPEQAHNGVCLERLGCGFRLVDSQPFRGDPDIYMKGLDTMSDKEILGTIEKFEQSKELKLNLQYVSQIMKKYRGVQSLLEQLEGFQ